MLLNKIMSTLFDKITGGRETTVQNMSIRQMLCFCAGCGKGRRCIKSWNQTNYYCAECIAIGGAICHDCVWNASIIEGIFRCTECEYKFGPVDEFQWVTQVTQDNINQINAIIDFLFNSQ